MGTDDKIDAKGDELKGKVKEGVGRATDDRDLEAEGHADQAQGQPEAGRRRRSRTPSRAEGPAGMREAPSPADGASLFDELSVRLRWLRCEPHRAPEDARCA